MGKFMLFTPAIIGLNKVSNLIEITGDDIALLGDADLRTLIGYLCEADYRLVGLSTKGITWSGHQDAGDGGLDVVIRGDVVAPKNSFIPRNNTGIQVKIPKMPKSAILKEMKPKGTLHEFIKALIKDKGAYIIISSKDSTTDPALKKRLDAMKEAVSGEINHQDICLDFMDRGRVATWVRLHPSLILWIRNKIGKELTGWCSYGNWAKTPSEVDDEYLLDDGLRLYDGTGSTEENLPAIDGLLRIRTKLLISGVSVRLTGLSGVGKTRLAQAIFDDKVGEEAINYSHAFYADIGDAPNPPPNQFVEQLIAAKTKAVLIIDNCPPDLHNRLTKLCTGTGSTVSLLTIEYDVRDDQPEETSVFRLKPASEVIIYKLIEKRFPYISQVDIRTIASFSGGNARIAIALANTLEKGETLSGFRDVELFERLFKQRHETNESLLISAGVCSLVYSFEGTDVESEKSELALLSSIAGKSALDLYRDVQTIKDRDLIQTRDVWRAVLPHAIANRLAKRALESIPKNTVVKFFINSGSERLMKSFSRRLNYLHDCDAAKSIAEEWLKNDGWIGEKMDQLNSFEMEVFKNISPVSPVLTLKAIERTANSETGIRFTSRENVHYSSFVRILRHLAYDQNFFIRSVNIMCHFALSEKPDEKNNSTRDAIKSLFYIKLSGTHAPIEERVKVIELLIDSDDGEKQALGMLLLNAALNARSVSTSREFNFGARSRDFGCIPKTYEDVFHWYKTVIDICSRMALSEQLISESARKVLSSNLRFLWRKGGIRDVLFDAIKSIHEQKSWSDAWISVCEIIRYDSKTFSDNDLEKINKLERLLRPAGLLERVRTYVLTEKNIPDIDDDMGGSNEWEKTLNLTKKLGEEVAQDSVVLTELLPELISINNNKLLSFGEGVSDGCSDNKVLWGLLCNQYKITLPEKRNINILLGFLSSCAKNDSEFYQSTLDDLLEDDQLGEWFISFQTITAIDERALKRLHKSLDIGKVHLNSYASIAWGRTYKPVSDENLSTLLKKIISIDGGTKSAIEILSMRFYGVQGNKSEPEYSITLINVAREVLSSHLFSDESHPDSISYNLEILVKVCLHGPNAVSSAKSLCENIERAISEGRIYVFDYIELLSVLALVQPFVFLDVFLGGTSMKEYQRERIFSTALEISENPLVQISDADILEWCEMDAINRYPLIIAELPFFFKSDETGKFTWKPIIYSILEQAKNLNVILEGLVKVIRPTMWNGSLAAALQDRLGLYKDLEKHENSEIYKWAQRQSISMQNEIDECQEQDRKFSKSHNERFE